MSPHLGLRTVLVGGVGGSGSSVAAAFDVAAFVGVGLRKSVVVAARYWRRGMVNTVGAWMVSAVIAETCVF
jgi:hypothetical protein